MASRHGRTPGPVAPETLLRLVAETVERIHGTNDLRAAALVLATSTVEHLGAEIAGVTVHPRRGAPQRLVATDDALHELDEEVADSPLTSPLGEGSAVRIRDTAADERWPRWVACAHALGIRSALLVGIPAVRGREVTLELYGYEADGGPQVELTVARQVITLVGLALKHADRTTNLEEALHTRGMVGEAQGILMERFKLDGDQAMSYLRRRSQDAQLPVRDLAAGIVAEAEDNSIRGKHGTDDRSAAARPAPTADSRSLDNPPGPGTRG